jgi:solute carrier family 25 folate transporter 32
MKLSQTAIDALAGSTSGLVVSVVMSPLDVMKTRLQVSRQPKDRISRGVLMIMKELYMEDGIKSFYKGLGTTMLGYIPNWSIYFVTYQYSRSTLYNSIDCK